jgi:putative ABC transport system substrate-binding protein
MIFTKRRLLLTLVLLHLCAGRCLASDVLVVADTSLQPVIEIVTGIGKTLRTSVKTFLPSQVKGRLESVVSAEQAKVVVALGKEAIAEALRLPPSVLVIFDLVVVPPIFARPNTTGFYMATPASQYTDFIANYLREVGRIAVIGSHDQLNILARGDSSRLATYSVKNPFDFVNTLRQLNGADAVLLLPDVSVLTAAAMEEAYLLSFKKKIPLLGVSEKNVKEGALFALVVDPVNVGKLIGEYAGKALKGANVGQIPPMPPRKFHLFLNLDTAKRMGIHLPEEVLRSAKRTYP